MGHRVGTHVHVRMRVSKSESVSASQVLTKSMCHKIDHTYDLLLTVNIEMKVAITQVNGRDKQTHGQAG